MPSTHHTNKILKYKQSTLTTLVLLRDTETEFSNSCIYLAIKFKFCTVNVCKHRNICAKYHHYILNSF